MTRYAHLISIFFRDLHQLAQNILSPDSPFHPSHAQSERFTDTTIYSPPSEGSQLKKRKRDVNGADIISSPPHIAPITNDLQSARLLNHMLANKHMSQRVHQIVKSECEQLITMVVRGEGL